jgi:GntR family phosphonate transport system transcriptional regulator
VTPAISRSGGIALWRQIEVAMEGAIRTGEHPPGARLPTEQELAVRFGVNRHTLRRAMESLEGRGLISIEQGRGSFVSEDVLDYPLGPRTRFSEIIRAQNREPAGRILAIETLPAPRRIAELLELRPGSRVVRVGRLSLADNRPVLLGMHHFPAARFPSIAGFLREDASVTRALARSGVPDYRRRSTRITARLPTPEEAALLEQPRNRPVLVTEALNQDPAGRPVLASIACYAGGRSQIVIEEDAA